MFQAIGSLLLEVITTSKQLWLVTESLDSIMDVFAEDINNIYIKELGVISTLQEILPQLKTMVRHTCICHSKLELFLLIVDHNRKLATTFQKYKKLNVI